MLLFQQPPDSQSPIFSGFFFCVRLAARTTFAINLYANCPQPYRNLDTIEQPLRLQAKEACAIRSVPGREAALGVFVPSWLRPVLAVAAASALRRGHRCLTDERE